MGVAQLPDRYQQLCRTARSRLVNRGDSLADSRPISWPDNLGIFTAGERKSHNSWGGGATVRQVTSAARANNALIE